jgi:hypothetical protein
MAVIVDAKTATLIGIARFKPWSSIRTRDPGRVEQLLHLYRARVNALDF